ncbi:hypothetical protein WISP_112509 [Willisornis vidua]|uniref:Reverse transcriptase/retrotransposon-derived protein RNase H-like domain-containing protein n=1 Tax=Willisornis vidua TaxID=1566151 RepID=A0ABQ9D094_9PASS|nr:hypothetical protein WISP_112509 [Willisornis vidua]
MAEVKVKPEVPDPMDIESRIIELCHQFPHGITDQVIQNDMPHMEAQQRAMAINRLLSMGQLDLLRSNAGLLYRIKDSQNASKMKGSDNQEKLVYQIIEDAGNKGIWSRDIRYKSNLPLTEINKILKNLESKKLIKAVKSVAASKKKVYMLYNLQPDRSVTGGAWYSDQDFESEFVEVLNQQCFKFLQSKAEAARESKQNPRIQRNSSFASSHEVWKYICELGISKVELSMEDIETILNTLIYDGKVEMTIIAAKEGTVGSVDGQMKLYRAICPLIQPTGLVRTPCGLCPEESNYAGVWIGSEFRSPLYALSEKREKQKGKKRNWDWEDCLMTPLPYAPPVPAPGPPPNAPPAAVLSPASVSPPVFNEPALAPVLSPDPSSPSLNPPNPPAPVPDPPNPPPIPNHVPEPDSHTIRTLKEIDLPELGINKVKFLYEKLSKDGLLKWGNEDEEQLTKLKEDLVNAPVLSLPDIRRPFYLFVNTENGTTYGVLTQNWAGHKKPVGYFSKLLDPVSRGWPTCLQAIVATALLVEEAIEVTFGAEFKVYTPHNIRGILQQKAEKWLTDSWLLKYEGILLHSSRLELEVTNLQNPAQFLYGEPEGNITHDCLKVIDIQAKIWDDVEEEELTEGEKLCIDGSSRIVDGRQKSGYAIIDGLTSQVRESGPLDKTWSAQAYRLDTIRLMVLTQHRLELDSISEEPDPMLNTAREMVTRFDEQISEEERGGGCNEHLK